MPELPEVESVVRRLDRLLAGKRIVKARLLRPGLAANHSPRQFGAALRNVEVERVGRRGKHILTHLANGRTLITHLRMTGRFFYLNTAAGEPNHVHAAFLLDDGHKLLFVDPRQFGTMLIARTAELSAAKPLAQLAPEPFSDEFSLAYLIATLRRSKQALKLALLDQTKVLGLGNIYVAEALHRAGIDPRLPAARLSKPRAARLHAEIVAVLSEAIANDTGFVIETGDLGESYGRHELISRVYEREGEPCLTCSAPIRRLTQGARSTYFCARCQRR